MRSAVEEILQQGSTAKQCSAVLPGGGCTCRKRALQAKRDLLATTHASCRANTATAAEAVVYK